MIYLGGGGDRNKVFIYLLFQLTEVQPTTYFLRKGKETEGLESDIINCTFWEQEFKWHSRNLGKSPRCSSPLKSLRITQSKVPITEAHHFPALRYPKFEAKSLSYQSTSSFDSRNPEGELIYQRRKSKSYHKHLNQDPLFRGTAA